MRDLIRWCHGLGGERGEHRTRLGYGRKRQHERQGRERKRHELTHACAVAIPAPAAMASCHRPWRRLSSGACARAPGNATLLPVQTRLQAVFRRPVNHPKRRGTVGAGAGAVRAMRIAEAGAALPQGRLGFTMPNSKDRRPPNRAGRHHGPAAQRRPARRVAWRSA